MQVHRIMRYKSACILAFILLFINEVSASEKIQGKLVIFHAGSLSRPLLEVEKAFKKKHPDVQIYREAAGSLASIRKITELKRYADIIAVADWELIPQLLIPEYCNRYEVFGKNSIVIVYSEKSKYASELNRNNWYEILLRKGVKIGRSDPERDPCGYRTLMVWQLAERYYKIPGLYERLLKACPKENIRPKETDLIALQEAGELDYHFNYRSVAIAHNMKYLELPDEINLGDRRFEHFYSQATVTISGKNPSSPIVKRGSPILYGIAILKNSANKRAAEEFVRFLLGSGL